MGDNQKHQQKLHDKQTEIGAGAAHTITHDFRQNHTQRRPARQTITSPTSSPLSPQPPTTPTPPSAGAAPPLNPNEITAEWTVRAHLTFARAGEKVQREFNSSDPLNPVRVVYKWSTVDTASNDGRDDETASTATIQSHKQQYGASRPTTPSKFSRPQPTGPSQFPDNASFRSTNSSLNADYGDSAFSSSNTSKSKQAPPHGSGSASASLYGTRCRSTCNIIVSAVADFLPADAMTSSSAANERDNYMQAHATTQREYVTVPGGEEPDPFVFNTTASYTVLPERPLDGHRGGSKNMTNFGKILALRDAYSQTSDTETKFFRDQHSLGSSRSPTYERQHNRQYDHRRATTEAVLRPPEANNFMPSYTPSPTQTFKSASLPRIPPLPGQQYGSKPAPTTATSEGQKKPRTVHIDVYCTGSEDEDDDDNADGESSSSGDSEHAGSKQHDLESNSTPQTVLDNEQMLLRHQRIAGRTLPRRLAPPPPTQQAGSQASPSQDSGLNLGHAITKSSTAEEVTESKQLLFRKHIGDQRAAKLATLRQKYIRQASDDALSSNYPNSSRSTMRDATCSSISSAVPSTHAADYADSSWKETEDFDETSFGLNKSESFEYENALDRLRIRQMENVWSRDDDDSMAARGGGDCVDSAGAHMMQHMQRVTHSPTPFHMLQTISEDSSQRDSPLRLPQQQQQAQFQRNDTLPSESDVFSESDHYHTYPGRYAGALPHFQRHLQSANDAATPYLQQTAHFSRNRPGFLQFFGPEATHAPNGVNVPASAPVTTSTADPLQFPISYQQPATAPPPPQLQRWKSEARENLTGNGAAAQAQLLQPQATMLRAGSEVPQSSTSASTFSTAMVGRRFDMKIQSPAPSDTSTAISGYTTEYLEKARVFGKVVAARKPGHHVGPTKNPSCSCDSCQRWLAERFQIRGRAFSLGERRPSLNRTN